MNKEASKKIVEQEAPISSRSVKQIGCVNEISLLSNYDLNMKESPGLATTASKIKFFLKSDVEERKHSPTVKKFSFHDEENHVSPSSTPNDATPCSRSLTIDGSSYSVTQSAPNTKLNCKMKTCGAPSLKTDISVDLDWDSMEKSSFHSTSWKSMKSYINCFGSYDIHIPCGDKCEFKSSDVLTHRILDSADSKSCNNDFIGKFSSNSFKPTWLSETHLQPGTENLNSNDATLNTSSCDCRNSLMEPQKKHEGYENFGFLSPPKSFENSYSESAPISGNPLHNKGNFLKNDTSWPVSLQLDSKAEFSLNIVSENSSAFCHLLKKDPANRCCVEHASLSRFPTASSTPVTLFEHSIQTDFPFNHSDFDVEQPFNLNAASFFKDESEIPGTISQEVSGEKLCFPGKFSKKDSLVRIMKASDSLSTKKKFNSASCSLQPLKARAEEPELSLQKNQIAFEANIENSDKVPLPGIIKPITPEAIKNKSCYSLKFSGFKSWHQCVTKPQNSYPMQLSERHLDNDDDDDDNESYVNSFQREKVNGDMYPDADTLEMDSQDFSFRSYSKEFHCPKNGVFVNKGSSGVRQSIRTSGMDSREGEIFRHLNSTTTPAFSSLSNYSEENGIDHSKVYWKLGGCCESNFFNSNDTMRSQSIAYKGTSKVDNNKNVDFNGENMTDSILDNETESRKNISEKIIKTAKIQSGSRYLQRILCKATPDIISIMCQEIGSRITELMVDQYGNYLCQQLFKSCTQEQRRDMLRSLGPNIYEVSCDRRGTHSMQSLITLTKLPEDELLLMNQLQPWILKLSIHPHGTHVIQKALVCFREPATDGILETIVKHLETAALNAHGLCVVKKSITAASNPESKFKKPLLSSLISSTLSLVQSPFGNYAIQHALQCWGSELCESILDQVKSNLISLSTQKFSSNVVEKVIESASSDEISNFVKAFTVSSSAATLVNSSYGTFVVQKVLEKATRNQVLQMYHALSDCIKIVQNRRYKAKWDRVVQKIEERIRGNHDDFPHVP